MARGYRWNTSRLFLNVLGDDVNRPHYMRFIVLIVLTLFSMSAFAYVGPGLGLGVIGALIGGVLAVLLAIAGVVWYPIKRLLKRMGTAEDSVEARSEDPPEEEGEDEIEKSNET